MTGEYDLSPEDDDGKLVITIAGDKGEGKSTTALMLPGTKCAISLDHKTTLIKKWIRDATGRDDAVVYNGAKYLSEDASDENSIVGAYHKSYHYLHALLSSFESDPPDWIVLDDVDTLHQICEGEMRYNHKLGPVEAFANLNFWKERRMFLRSLHNKAKTIAKKGVVYTTYMDNIVEIVENEKTVNGKRVPKWIDVILKESDIALNVYNKDDVVSGKRRYFVKVLSSKKHSFIDEGAVIDVTGLAYAKLYKALPIITPSAPKPKPKGQQDVEIVVKDESVNPDESVKPESKVEEDPF